MGNKNKTVSFRVNEDSFEALGTIADRHDISLSSLFRNYVDMFIGHEGRVTVAPEHVVDNDDGEIPSDFPPTVKVSKSLVREHERLELETEHLRDQLEEYKRYATQLRTEVEEAENEDVIHLEDLDDGPEETSFKVG